MIPLINYDYSEGEQGSVVMKFTQMFFICIYIYCIIHPSDIMYLKAW